MPQSRAANCLGKIGSKAATNALISALQDQDRRIENEAVIALGKLADAAAIPILLRSLGHHSMIVRNSAAKSLNSLNEQWTPQPFIAELANQEERVAVFAIEALGEMKSRNAIDALSVLVTSENKKIRKAAEKAIKFINK
jgi:HEAT repeat protein